MKWENTVKEHLGSTDSKIDYPESSALLQRTSSRIYKKKKIVPLMHEIGILKPQMHIPDPRRNRAILRSTSYMHFSFG